MADEKYRWVGAFRVARILGYRCYVGSMAVPKKKKKKSKKCRLQCNAWKKKRINPPTNTLKFRFVFP